MSSKHLDWFDNIEARPHPWPGLNWLTPMLYVKDVKAAVSFYESAFQFVSIFELPNERGELEFARMRYRGCNFTLSRENKAVDPQGQAPTSTDVCSVLFYVYVDDVDNFIQQALEKGCSLIRETRLEFWGDRKARLKDPFGYIWDFATKA